MARNFIEALERFAAYRDIARLKINRATVCVTERYARRRLKVKKSMPLVYRGMVLVCIGSKRVRNEEQTSL